MSSTLKAALWMGAWLTCMMGMTVAARELLAELPVFVVVLWRSLIGVVLLTPVAIWRSGAPLRTRRLPMHIARNTMHYAAQSLWFLALSLIPLAQLVSIEFTMPIWMALLAAAFLGERLNSWRIAAVVLGLAGILVIVRPGMTTLSTGDGIALCAAFGFAGAVAMTKSLTRTEAPFTILFYMMLIQLVIGLIPAALTWTWPSPHNWGWIAVVGIVGTCSHYCLAKAMQHADATVVVPLDFLRVPLTAIAGYFIYGEEITVWLVLGASFILIGNMLNLLRGATPAIRSMPAQVYAGEEAKWP